LRGFFSASEIVFLNCENYEKKREKQANGLKKSLNSLKTGFLEKETGLYPFNP